MIQQYPLKTGWMMQSSQKLSCFGNTISRPSFQPHDWYPVSVPQTVVGGLFENKVIDDPFYDEVMKQMQGFKRSALSHFSFHHMPDSSPFRHSWWYRTEFCLSQKNEITNKRVWLRINGINNCANLWINSRRCAGNDYITGSFRWFFFDVTSFIDTDGMNALAVELFAPQPDDLCITFIDWNPVPPDDCMGIWQPISIEVTGPGIMKNPWVNSEVQLNDCLKADLCLQVDIENTTDKPMNGVLRGVLADRPFAQEVQLPQYSTSKLKLRCEDFSQFRMENPRLWWPYQLGEPFLYSVELNFEIDGVVSDTYQGTFGIRQVSSRINEHGSRLFTVNGIDLLIRGAAWSPDLLLRQSEQRDRIDIAFLKTMNLNALRFEGHFGSDHFWRLCDREGILVFAGWPCCTQWERWEYWKPGDYQIAEQSLRSQLYRLRNHPSLTCWLYGSDYPPPEPVERLYLSVLEQLYPQLPTLSSASAHAAAFSGRSGVKMSGPYTFVPPQYWYDPSKPGVAYGFNTETGPDVCIPVIDSLKKMFSSDHLKPGCDAWNHHAGLAAFRMTDLIQEAIEKRYGQPDDIEDFARVSQVLSYECW
ncbi:MAG: hypothetical protein JW795_17845, partial [Chitinivibrionales bacterium]|nr:hypothetical protein [Chitinivibrionales bacterium]